MQLIRTARSVLAHRVTMFEKLASLTEIAVATGNDALSREIESAMLNMQDENDAHVQDVVTNAAKLQVQCVASLEELQQAIQHLKNAVATKISSYDAIIEDLKVN